ncbi:MAG: hypothetical protein L0229_23155 [Blastocatellia bacterium]|nr:hypothetical protein [Blastocatellia bacterium]
MPGTINNLIRKYILAHAHPMKFVAEALGVMWSVFFLWNRNWIAAVVASTLFFLLTTLILWNKPSDGLAKSPLGKILLVYATPLNFFFYNFSALPLIYGLWVHSTVYILIGVTLLLLPHLWAWKNFGSDGYTLRGMD